MNSRRGYYDKRQDFYKALESIGMGRVTKVQGMYYYSDFTLTPETKREYTHVYGHDVCA